MNCRQAEKQDIKAIVNLLREAAKRKEPILPRTEQEIRRLLPGFWVCYSEKQELVGSCGAKPWKGLFPEVEIISWVVKPKYRHQGIGKYLLKCSMDNLLNQGFQTFFVLTTSPSAFRRMGFRQVKKTSLPHKVFGDCLRCSKNKGINPYSVECDEIALVLERKNFV